MNWSTVPKYSKKSSSLPFCVWGIRPNIVIGTSNGIFVYGCGHIVLQQKKSGMTQLKFFSFPRFYQLDFSLWQNFFKKLLSPMRNFEKKWEKLRILREINLCKRGFLFRISKLISRKIWMVQKSINFHTVIVNHLQFFMANFSVQEMLPFFQEIAEITYRLCIQNSLQITHFSQKITELKSFLLTLVTVLLLILSWIF